MAAPLIGGPTENFLYNLKEYPTRKVCTRFYFSYQNLTTEVWILPIFASIDPPSTFHVREFMLCIQGRWVQIYPFFWKKFVRKIKNRQKLPIFAPIDPPWTFHVHEFMLCIQGRWVQIYPFFLKKSNPPTLKV